MAEENSQDGFDPASLKMAKLRGVLFDHGIEYASNAKKGELVELYRQHIGPTKTQSIVIDDLSQDELPQIETKTIRKQKKDKKSKHVVAPGQENSEKNESLLPVESHEKITKKKKTRKPSKRSEKAAIHEVSADVKGDTKAEPEKPTSGSLGSAITPTKIDGRVNEISTPEKVNKTPESMQKNSDSEPKFDENGSKDLAKSHAKDAESHAKNPESSSASKSRKRKSMLEGVDLKLTATPSKGNIFEVDSDSETELLSSRRKRQKSQLEVSFAESSKSPISKSKRAPNSESSFQSPVLAKVSTEGATPEVAKKTVEESSLMPEVPSRSTEKSFSTPSQREPSYKASKVETPLLQEPPQDASSANSSTVLSESTEEPSLWFKSQSSFQLPDENSHTGESLKTHSSAAHSFDSALSKLKKETKSEDVLPPKDKMEELAKLLNIDVSSVKPRQKGLRSITPRRPIVVPSGLLSRSRGSSPKIEKVNLDAVEDELSSDDEEDKDTVVLEKTSLAPPTGSPSQARSQLQQPKFKSRPSVKRALIYLFLWLGLVSTLLFGYWYREQTFLVGYCGQEIHRRTIPNTPSTSKTLVRLGDYLDKNFRPDCVECPQHARCFPRLEIACYDDFVVSAPWYYSYVPNFDLRAQKCVPDTKKAEKIEIMIDVALDLLRARNANENCGRSDADDTSAGLEVSELHDLLLALKAPYITEEEFEELWERSVVELEKEPEIIVRFTDHIVASPVLANDTVTETHYQSKILRSTSLSHISFKCMMSNTVLSLALRFKRALAAVALFFAVSYAIYWKYTQYKLHAHKVETIYHEVLSKLRRQAKLGKGSRELPEFIGSVQLRDLILSNERNLAYKMRLWQAVSQKVDHNTNVKHELLEVHGEVMKVWQWISSVE